MENGYYGSKAFENYCRTWSEQETNVLIGDVSEKDREIFLGPTFGFETFHEAVLFAEELDNGLELIEMYHYNNRVLWRLPPSMGTWTEHYKDEH